MFYKNKKTNETRPVNRYPKEISKDDQKTYEEKESNQRKADMESEGGRY